MKSGFSLGELKISDRCFLGKEELVRQQFFLIEKLRLLTTFSGKGILGKEDFVVTEDTLGEGTVKISESLAIDADGKFIYKELQSGIKIPEGSFWMFIRFKETSLEKGVCSISSSGGVYIVNGVGTEFTKTFRGVSNLYKPSRVEFEKIDPTQTLQNSGSYTVLEVISDSQLLLSDPVYDEVNVKVKSVGTFSHDTLPVNSDRFIYKNYGCELLLIPEVISGQKPSSSSFGIEGETIFSIASIFNSSGNLTIVDKREVFYTKLESFVTESEWETLTLQTSFIQDSFNPIKIRYNHFKGQLEIFGKFTTSLTSGVILILPEKYKPINPTILKMINTTTKEELLLNLSVEGVLSLYDTEKSYSTIGSNFLYSQIFSIL